MTQDGHEEELEAAAQRRAVRRSVAVWIGGGVAAVVGILLPLGVIPTELKTTALRVGLGAAVVATVSIFLAITDR